MQKACMKENRCDESPDLSLLLYLSCIFPAQFVQGSWIWCQEFSVDHFVEPEGDYEHYDVDDDDEDCECTASQGWTKISHKSTEK